MKTINKINFDQEFKTVDLKYIAQQYEKDGIPDRPARREVYNNKIDTYQKDGLITEKQAGKWCITDRLETTLYWLK